MLGQLYRAGAELFELGTRQIGCNQSPAKQRPGTIRLRVPEGFLEARPRPGACGQPSAGATTVLAEVLGSTRTQSLCSRESWL
jgi:hypothetical protein